ncbi:MAG: FtsW/RodA/SpoVE family cell cycle protein [bacterium]
MKNNLKNMDKPLFILVTILSIFGAVMIYTASSVSTILRYDTETWHFFSNQLIFIAFMYFIAFPLVLNYPTKKYAKFQVLILVVCAFSLLSLLLFGESTNSAVSWFSIADKFSIQPSEFAKSFIIVLSSIYYNMINKGRQTATQNFSVLGLGLGAAFLVSAQPDLGSAVILAGISVMMFLATPFVYKNGKKFVMALFVLGIMAVGTFYTLKENFLTPMQLSRFEFAQPCQRISEDTGYQVCNGFIAINNGGMFGVGFGNSTQKYLYLPESHTDFIFPIIIEEVGYISGIIILIIYILILSRLIKIAREAHNIRCSMLAYGTFCFISLHIFVNLYGILALMPLTGVPLPFLSYGGSSIANCLLMVFISLRVSVENREEEIKKVMSKYK